LTVTHPGICNDEAPKDFYSLCCLHVLHPFLQSPLSAAVAEGSRSAAASSRWLHRAVETVEKWAFREGASAHLGLVWVMSCQPALTSAGSVHAAKPS
jgi:hypothetical protein